MKYIHVLDTQECIGPFKDEDEIDVWIHRNRMRGDFYNPYEVVSEPPSNTIVTSP